VVQVIFITGDIHGKLGVERFTSKRFPEQLHLTKEDYLIVTGDFGLIWDNSEQEIAFRHWLNSLNYTTLFIDGNHENFDTLDSYPVEYWNGGKVHFIADHIIHLMRGQVFDIQGVKIFTMGGAQSIDKQARKPGVTWWERELPSAEEYEEALANLEKHNWQVDYVITHDCSEMIFNELKKRIWPFKLTNHLRIFLDNVEERGCFKHWYFGHFHLDLKIDDKHTMLYQSILQID